MTPKIWGTATAVPPHVVTQEEAVDFARSLFSRSLPETERLLGAFHNAGIQRRHLVRPPDWYATPRTFPERNEIYRTTALDLAEEAGRGAIQAAGIDPSRLGGIVLVSSTGLSTPSLDSVLVQRLGLSRNVGRLPIWGLGCSGGAAGLAHAASWVRGNEEPALLIAVEVCSVTFLREDRRPANLIATALFADGAAAAVVGPEGEGPALLNHHSHLFEDTQDVMGWSLEEEGLGVIFSKSIPGLVREVAPAVTAAAARRADLEPSDLFHFLLHPGGAKVLTAFADALELEPGRLDLPRRVLRDYGNMSSATVLFVLHRLLSHSPPSDEPGILMSLGPGFSAEAVLFRW